MRSLYVLALFVSLVFANTESILLTIPHYYDIPFHPQRLDEDSSVYKSISINNTHSIVYDFPIGNKYHTPISSVLIPNNGNNLQQTLLVKLNNYEDSTFFADDKLYVKLCWPATEPFSYDLDYEFIPSSSPDVLDLYVVIKYHMGAYSVDRKSHIESTRFHLHITKLAWLPIPLEIVYLITYMVDVLIIVIAILPRLKRLVEADRKSR